MSFNLADVFDAKLLLVALFALLTGLTNSVLDLLADEVAFDRSVFKKWPRSFWLKTVSWVNKYKRYKTGKLVVKKYRDNGSPIYTPRFWGSTTVFVFLTDGWHLVQFVQWSFASAAIVTALGYHGLKWLLAWFFVRGFISSGFSIGYESIFVTRSHRR